MKKPPLWFALGIFLLCLVIGFRLAQSNPIENDESYSQHESIQGLTYSQILSGKVAEGNNTPLFYFLQKIYGQVTGFQHQMPWIMEQFVCEKSAQWRMRVLPIIFMSLAITFSCIFFMQRCGLWVGVLVLALFLTTPIIWIYWAQNRPYGLWILLSTWQILLLIDHVGFKQQRPSFYRQLTVCHWLLCLTTGFGLIQTLLTSLFIQKKWPFVIAMPAIIGIFYALQAPKYPFRVPTEWHSLILDNFSLERMLLIIALGVFFFSYKRLYLWMSCLLFFALGLIAWIASQKVGGKAGFELSARYFLFLLPNAILLVVFLWHKAWERWHKNKGIALLLIQCMLLVTVLGVWRTMPVVFRLW